MLRIEKSLKNSIGVLELFHVQCMNALDLEFPKSTFKINTKIYGIKVIVPTGLVFSVTHLSFRRINECATSKVETIVFLHQAKHLFLQISFVAQTQKQLYFHIELLPLFASV